MDYYPSNSPNPHPHPHPHPQPQPHPHPRWRRWRPRSRWWRQATTTYVDDERNVPVVIAHACGDIQPLKWAKVVRPLRHPPILGSAVSLWCSVIGEEARAVWRAAEAAAMGATRRARGIGLALDAARPAAAAAGDGGAGSARRREKRSALELGTGTAAERLVAHVTQPTLWEPGVT